MRFNDIKVFFSNSICWSIKKWRENVAKNCFGPRKKFVFWNFIMLFQIQYFSLCGGMVDVSVLGTDVNRRVGSSPTKGSSLPPKGRPSCDKKRSFPCPNTVWGRKSMCFKGEFAPLGLKSTRVKPLIQSRSFFHWKKICTLVPNSIWDGSIHGRVVDCTALIMRLLFRRRWFKPNWMQ